MYTIGIDVGGTNIVAGVVTADGQIIAKASLPTHATDDAQMLANDLIAVAKAACVSGNINESEIKGIGLGLPGSVDNAAGEVIYCCNIPALTQRTPLAKMLQVQWNLPIALENDANAAALGEACAGSAKGCNDVLFITLGTGVGGGIIANGKVYSGFNGLGGELGHMVIVHNGVRCGCGRNGCWESYASATALIRYTREAMEQHKNSKLWDFAATPEEVNGRTAFDAMRAGDDVAKSVVNYYIEMLACGLTNMVNILQPAVVCIGGGIANEGDTLLAPLTKIVHRDDYNKTDRKVIIRKALLGNDAGVIGAAMALR